VAVTEAIAHETTDVLDVLVVDDDPLARQAIRTSLEGEEGMVVCGEASSGLQGVELARLTAPDVIVMDVTMPDLDGIGATRRILEAQPDAKVVVFSATRDDDLGLLALRAGAMGFLTKGIDLSVLPRVIRGVASGEAAITRKLSAKVLRNFRMLADGAVNMRPVRSELTAREWEVLGLLCAEDKTTAGIAEELELSTETVRSHIKHIMRKLGVHSRAEAVVAANELRGHWVPAGAPAFHE
jgi:two-component system, NarL family, response regulator LiaR